MPESISTAQYTKLRSDLEKILVSVRKEEDAATSAATVLGYWKIGERIAREKLETGASYHNPILRDLSEDLQVDLRSLQQTLRLHQFYPKPPALPELPWTHLRLLVAISDDRERSYYEELAATEKWSYRQLSAALRADRYLEFRRSKNKNRIVLERPDYPDYRYSVEVRRVIDADTIIVDVDVGFEMFKRQTMRLARIDCLDRSTTQGDLARRFVQAELLNAQRVVIQSQKSDIHGRYIAHVFYTDRKLSIHATVKHGEYLNQKLLDRGYARAL